MIQYKFNKDVKYKTGPYYNPKTISFHELDFAVTETESIRVKVPDPFHSYLNPPIKNDSVPKMWNSHPIQFYQNQLNFAIFCATTGCGVSYADHMNNSNLLTKCVYTFHVYYQCRRILSELQAPMPHEKSWNPFNNRINMKVYERLCNEFNIDFKTDFRQKQDKNHGMGTLYLWGVHRRYNFDYWPGHTSFSSNVQVQLGSIEQEHHNAWTTFILDTGKGFTGSGVERINESIRTYAWCLLGSQAQTRSNIMRTSTGFGAQKQLLSNLEDVINSAVDLPSSIKRYQDSLRYARSKVDFAVGNGLYMLPSDLQLQIGTITNYNNEIIIASDTQPLGKGEELNSEIRTMLQPYHNEQKQSVTSEDHAAGEDHSVTSDDQAVSISDDHESQKTALVIGGVGVGLLLLYSR